MSEWAIIRAYLLDAPRGLVVTAMLVTFVLVGGLLLTGRRDAVGSMSVPLILAAFMAWDFRAFRHARK